MIDRLSPSLIIFIGFILVVTGVVLPFLMVVKMVPSTFFLNFFSYGASLLGLMLGIIGASMYIRNNKNKRK